MARSAAEGMLDLRGRAESVLDVLLLLSSCVVGGVGSRRTSSSRESLSSSSKERSVSDMVAKQRLRNG